MADGDFSGVIDDVFSDAVFGSLVVGGLGFGESVVGDVGCGSSE